MMDHPMELVELDTVIGRPSVSAPQSPIISMEYLPVSHIPPPNVDEDSDETDNIYRGERPPSPPPPPPPRSPPPPSVASNDTSSSSSSSSSNSSFFGGRLGAISAVVEHAITHWARAWASTSSLSSSSSSSSSTSSSSSNSRTTKSRIRRRRRSRSRSRLSLADIHNAKSERDVAARIQARALARRADREFVLYTPPSSTTAAPTSSTSKTDSGVLRTTSLPQILGQLSFSLKDNLKSRRVQEIARTSPPHAEPSPSTASVPASTPFLHHDYMIPEDLQRKNMSANGSAPSTPPCEEPRKKAKRGKGKAGRPVVTSSISAPTIEKVPSERNLDRAWWLDVSSPRWEDMRQIGKLLHLHPLTLEDILQQDPREKLELFPKLGYYFISFRAVESRKTRERRRAQAKNDLHDESIVGEVNVYLVVFREGVCSFHFSDISEHADAVRSRVLALDEAVTMSSDWIAHGIIDSIVDSFFPFLEVIEKEILDIESIVFSTAATDSQAVEKVIGSSDSTLGAEKDHVKALKAFDEKRTSLSIKENETYQSGYAKTHSSLLQYPLMSLRRVKQAYKDFRSMMYTVPDAPTTNQNMETVHRMAKTRRLVTSLTRFLAAKSEVVAQIRKRMLKTGEAGLGNGTGDDKDVWMYMGDVQDHILTLQQSLAHYERMLSQSHPTYLMELRLSVSKAKAASDKSIVMLSIISIGVLSVQTLIGLHSMNVHVPENATDSNKYTVFGTIIALSFLITVVYGIIVRRWWVNAKKRRGKWSPNPNAT